MTTALEKLTKLSNRVIRILGCNPGPMTLQGTNTYLIGTGKSRVLLDTGDGQKPEYFTLLSKALRDAGDISIHQVLLSHWHYDHVGGVEEIMSNIEPGCMVKKYPRVSDSDLCKTFAKLRDEEIIEIEGATLKVIHTPGHTEDHIVVHLLEDNAIFSGDCILGEGTAVFEDLHDYMQSLQKILSLDPSTIYPGHGPVVTAPSKYIAEYIAHRQLRENQILKQLQATYPKELSSMDIVKCVYVGTPENLHNAAASNVTHHLAKLAKERKIDAIFHEDIIKYKWRPN